MGTILLWAAGILIVGWLIVYLCVWLVLAGVEITVDTFRAIARCFCRRRPLPPRDIVPLPEGLGDILGRLREDNTNTSYPGLQRINRRP